MPIAKTTEDYVLCSTSISPHQMAKPTELTFPRILLSTNVPSAEKLQFTSLIQPGKIVVCLAQNKGNGRQGDGKTNLWKIGFILN